MALSVMAPSLSDIAPSLSDMAPSLMVASSMALSVMAPSLSDIAPSLSVMASSLIMVPSEEGLVSPASEPPQAARPREAVATSREAARVLAVLLVSRMGISLSVISGDRGLRARPRRDSESSPWRITPDHRRSSDDRHTRLLGVIVIRKPLRSEPIATRSTRGHTQ